MSKKTFFIVLLSSLNVLAFGQSNYPLNYFSSPINSNLSLTGNFGEIRPDHFHAGFDIKTNSDDGVNVYSIADGYVSRIKVSPYGYGNALYITHPNGYTSVYAHLEHFYAAIDEYVLKLQYQLQSFEIDTLLPNNLFTIKKGDCIALSGNTGSSQGPHLHFEIRDAKTEKIINPHYFNFNIPDSTAPVINQIVIYPLDENTTVNNDYKPVKIIPKTEDKVQYIDRADSVNVFGKIGIGIECYDTDENSKNKNAVFSVELQSGGKRVYYHQMETFVFENTKYVNAHIDYQTKHEEKETIQKCYVSKNNEMGIYQGVKNNGILNFDDEKVHWIRLIVKDFAGNENVLMFKIKSIKPINIPETFTNAKNTIQPMNCLIENTFTNDDIQITFPAKCLYDDIHFSYLKVSNDKYPFAAVHLLHNDYTPLHKNIELKIKVNEVVDSLKNKLAAILINDKGKETYINSHYENGFVLAQCKKFGNISVTIDTISPKIKPVFNMPKSEIIDIKKTKKVQFVITDNLSGIDKYIATIDDKWVLMQYDAKNSLFTLIPNKELEKGKHKIKITCTDKKQNISSLDFYLITY